MENDNLLFWWNKTVIFKIEQTDKKNVYKLEGVFLWNIGKLPHGEQQISYYWYGNLLVGEQSKKDIIETVQFALDRDNFFDMAGGHSGIFRRIWQGIRGVIVKCNAQVHFGAN